MKSADPIRQKNDVERFKKYLAGNARDSFYFILAINCGLRSGDLLKLRIGNLANLKVGETFELIEGKTKKKNYITMNKNIKRALDKYLQAYPERAYDDYIFFSRKGDSHLTVTQAGRIISNTAKALGLNGSYGCHSLRKTWGYHQRIYGKVSFELICKRYNHSNPEVTMRYLGIQDSEVEEICLMNI